VAKKWSDKKEAVAKLTAAAEKKRLVAGDYSDLTRTLKKVSHSLFSLVSQESE
jgi:hypothetical protein